MHSIENSIEDMSYNAINRAIEQMTKIQTLV